MSLAETKNKVLEKVASVQDEEILQLVIIYLDTFKKAEMEKVRASEICQA